MVTPWLVYGLTPNPDVEGTRRRYAEVEKTLGELLARATQSDCVVVVTHFAPTYLTLQGENPASYGELGSKRLEQVIKRYRPDLWIHGHAHRSKNTYATLYGTKIYNVALPATAKITLIDPPRTRGQTH